MRMPMMLTALSLAGCVQDLDLDAREQGVHHNCSATYTITAQTRGRLEVSVTLRNHGARSAGWSVDWQFADGEEIVYSPNANFSQSGARAQLFDAAFNAAIPSGGAVTVSFLGTRTGTATVPSPITCTIE